MTMILWQLSQINDAEVSSPNSNVGWYSCQLELPPKDESARTHIRSCRPPVQDPVASDPDLALPSQSTRGMSMIARRLSTVLVPVIILLHSHLLPAQDTSHSSSTQLYTGYTWLSNSFNTYSNFPHSGLNGWDAALTIHATGALGLKVAASGYYGTQLDASVFEHSILVGPQYTGHFRKESLFAHGLVGLGFINSGAIPFDNSSPSSNATVAVMAGGGLDSPISHRISWRLEGDFLYTHFNSNSDQIHGLASYFGRVSTGPVWRF